MEWLNWLIPAILGLSAGVVGSLLMRKTNKESNETDAFEVVTRQLFQLNTDLRTDVEKLEKRVGRVEEERDAAKQENADLRGQLDDVREELSEVKEVNGSLARNIAKLVGAWPTGYALPELDYDWRKHLLE